MNMGGESQKAKYAHLTIGQEVDTFAGHYTPEKEVRLTCNGHDLFYVIGHVVMKATSGKEKSCDRYATVPGYILSWRRETNRHGLLVTEVELITNAADREAIRSIVLKNENVARVDFWF
ncbi:MAG TPA: hypothetical protein VEI27_01785 [Dehalococcoidales bacterium]|nr:hypothetical protein [Dehalococcoidales bacterium]